MDEKNKFPQEEEFTLEDILQEFGSFEDANAQQELPEEEDVRVWDGQVPAEPVSPVDPQDTVPLNEITQAVQQAEEKSADATQRFTPVSEPVEQTADATQRFAPVGEWSEEAQEPVVPVQEETVEPFSQEWEPEYEEPMGEYIPPEPIVFRPKNRLRELKHKLVEGPEKRYYELLEKGLGKLQVAIFCCLIVTALAAGSTAMYALNIVGSARMKTLVFGQLLFLLLSAMLGSYQLLEGVADMFRKRFSLNSLLVLSFLACLADGVLCLKTLQVPCCGVFSLNVTMSLWSTFQKRKTEMSQMDTMRKATQLDGVKGCADGYEGRTVLVRQEGQVEDFMDSYAQPSGLEKTFCVYALAALLVSLCVAIIALVMGDIYQGIHTLCAALLVAIPATAFVTFSRPMALLERRLHKLGAVLCGWQGVKALSRPVVFPLTDTDLFPAGSAKLNGVKFYGQREPDQVIAYAAALICADGGGMAPLFSQLLESRSGYHYEAEQLQSYSGGIGGEVCGESVLAGTLSFVQSMGVDMPEGTRVSQAVYVVIDGSLAGVFAVSYTKTKMAAAGLTTLCAYRGLTPALTAGDFMLTEGFLRSKFGVNTRRIAFLSRQDKDRIRSLEPEEESPSLAMTTREGLAGAAFAVTGARALKLASICGLVIHMLGGILGLLIVLALTVVGAQHLLTPANLLLFELIWLIPGLLITEWTRNV